MKSTFIASLVATAVVAIMASSAHAEPGWCKRAVSAQGRANIEEGSRPDLLACTRAKRRWSAKVAASCECRSRFWWRARGKHLDQDAGAGQRRCTATGIPARKIFGC